MKKIVISFPIVISIIVAISSCSKKEDNNNTPVEKKKYAWIAGNEDSTGYGLILFSNDAGENWLRQGQGQTALAGVDLSDIWAVDEDVIWAVGSNNTILRSQNGGQGWLRIQSPAHPANPNLLTICILNRDNIWISGGNGAVYNSLDGGSNWTVFDTNFFQSGRMQGIWVINSQRIFVVGGVEQQGRAERGFVGYTVDGGTTWETFVPANDYNKNGWISVVSHGYTVVIYGGKSHYMVSTDEGETWRNDSLDVGGGGGKADINHMIMPDDLTWWAAMDEGHIVLTGNGGSTWDDQGLQSAGGMFLIGISAYDMNLALVVGETNGYPPMGGILRTTNGGTTWSIVRLYHSALQKVSFIH